MAADIRTENVEYSAPDATLRGFLARPAEAGGPRPGVLVVHEWWGLNDYVRGRAKQLAELGYTALAVDMYGEGKVASGPEEANQLMSAALGDVPGTEARFRAGLDRLRGEGGVDGAKIAGIGYCFGGAMVLHAARKGMALAGVVSFHGALGSLHRPAPGSVRARILVCHGGADALVPADDVTAFRSEMDAAEADYRFVSYEGALHGFTNPEATEAGQKFGMPLAYDAAADERSWSDMKEFFGQIFG